MRKHHREGPLKIETYWVWDCKERRNKMQCNTKGKIPHMEKINYLSQQINLPWNVSSSDLNAEEDTSLIQDVLRTTSTSM